MSKVSVIIPARNEPWLAKTVDDIFAKATGEIEVIVTLDGYWPEPMLQDRPNLILVHHGEAKGMRASLNSMVRMARGKFVMKLDAHCMVGPGFDEILAADCEYDWLAIPSRHSLVPETWEIRTGKWHAIEYDYLTFPYEKDNQYGTGLHAKKWMADDSRIPSSYYAPEIAKQDILVDDIMTWQGSCWFMHRDKFLAIDQLDTVYSFNIHQEAQELGFKIWLGSNNGRMVINKKTWYAHWHKDNRSGRGFKLSYQAMRETERMGTWYWMNNKWPKQVRPMKWLIDKFWPIPGWPENWEEVKKQFEEADSNKWCGKNLRVFDPNGHDALGMLSRGETT
jgi:glycosyltransferase involved in cell wall biosynthesis